MEEFLWLLQLVVVGFPIELVLSSLNHGFLPIATAHFGCCFLQFVLIHSCSFTLASLLITAHTITNPIRSFTNTLHGIYWHAIITQSLLGFRLHNYILTIRYYMILFAKIKAIVLVCSSCCWSLAFLANFNLDLLLQALAIQIENFNHFVSLLLDSPQLCNFTLDQSILRLH